MKFFTPPPPPNRNYEDLAKLHKPLQRYLKKKARGGASIDFQNAKAVRELNNALLWKDLTPTAGSSDYRLDYVMWIEKLLDEEVSEGDSIRGVDIGTEISERSVEFARENVQRNKMLDRIKVELTSADTIFPSTLFAQYSYDFCMCNPPFYANTEDLMQGYKTKDNQPTTVCTGSEQEMVTEGGEISFIKRIVKESQLISQSIRWFTTLVAKKADFDEIRRELAQDHLRVIVKVAEFRYTRTVRWGIAWTYST
ncbi:hypothetical protein BC829DRAFT_388973 [Chytridium lagenaria]|nr:hypothetical protein BC829DRAFT_388973 [Chytridium lagenaria]